jgi:hypothetical protein
MNSVLGAKDAAVGASRSRENINQVPAVFIPVVNIVEE